MAIVLTDEDLKKAFAEAGSDLKFLLDRENVDETIQGKLFHIGIRTVRQFGAFVADRTELTVILKTNFEIDGAADIMMRVKITKLVVAWETAKVRAAKMAEMDATGEATSIPKALAPMDKQSMRAAFEQKWWELEDRRVPGKSYLEKKLDEVEKNELKAEPLSEVLSTNEDEPDTLRTVWDASGELKAVKVSSTVPLPSGSEELRTRIVLLGTAWQFVAFQHTHREYLKKLTPQVFQEYLDYLLGEFVWGLHAKDGRGNSFGAPSWHLVIAYEHAIRVKAVTLVKKGHLFKDALRMAWEDSVTKERNFTTPLGLEGAGQRKRRFDDDGRDQPTNQPNRKHKTDSKGKGKHSDKVKGKGKHSDKGKSKGGCKFKNDKGEQLCYAFNNEGCAKRDCKYKHQCGTCFKEGIPMFRCNHQ